MSEHERIMGDIVRSMRGLPPERTTRVCVDPKMIEDRNPCLTIPDYAGTPVATFRSFPVSDPFAETKRRPMELVATSSVPVVSMVVFKDRLFVATSEGVFERDEDGVFREVTLVKTKSGSEE